MYSLSVMNGCVCLSLRPSAATATDYKWFKVHVYEVVYIVYDI